MNVNMFGTNKIIKNRQAKKHMYLQKKSKERILKEMQIKHLLDYTTHLINTKQYKLNNNNISQNITDIEAIEPNIKTDIKPEIEIIETDIKPEIEIIEPDIYSYKNNVLEWSTDYEKDPDKYMTRLIQIINKILNNDNNDINSFTYRDLIKDDLKTNNSEDIFLAIKNYKTNLLPIKYNISETIYNQKIPLEMLGNSNEIIIYSENRVLELDINTDNNANDNDNNIDTKKLENKKGKFFNFNKINKINNDSQNTINKKNIITEDMLLNKLNSLIEKVNDKVENEISKDLFMISQSTTDQISSRYRFNLICSMVLDKIGKIFN